MLHDGELASAVGTPPVAFCTVKTVEDVRPLIKAIFVFDWYSMTSPTPILFGRAAENVAVLPLIVRSVDEPVASAVVLLGPTER